MARLAKAKLLRECDNLRLISNVLGNFLGFLGNSLDDTIFSLVSYKLIKSS